MCGCMCHGMCVEVGRQLCGVAFVPLTYTWVPGAECRLPGMGEMLYLQNHLSSPGLIFPRCEELGCVVSIPKHKQWKTVQWLAHHFSPSAHGAGKLVASSRVIRLRSRASCPSAPARQDGQRVKTSAFPQGVPENQVFLRNVFV